MNQVWKSRKKNKNIRIYFLSVQDPCFEWLELMEYSSDWKKTSNYKSNFLLNMYLADGQQMLDTSGEATCLHVDRRPSKSKFVVI